MKNIKRVALTTLAATVLATGFGSGNEASAAYGFGEGLSIHDREHEILNGKILNGRTYGPIRAIGEELEAKVNWDNKTKTVTIIKDYKTITLKTGLKTLTVNGRKISMDATPYLSNGTIYLPMKYIGEALGEDIRWDKERQLAIFGDEMTETTEDNIYVYAQPIFFRDAIEILIKKVANSGTRYTNMVDPDFVDYSYPTQTSMKITRTMVVGINDVKQVSTLVKKNGKWSVSSIVETSEMYRP